MSTTQLLPSAEPAAPDEPKRLNLFERYLTVWVGLCMFAGVLLGRLAPGLTETLRGLEFGSGSQINAPIAVLIWLMIVPMMLKIDFWSLAGFSLGLLSVLAVHFILHWPWLVTVIRQRLNRAKGENSHAGW